MNDNFFFSMERLQELERYDLQRLADYYNVSYSKNTSSKILIKKIMLAQSTYDYVSDAMIAIETEQPMSERVRRIKESQIGG